MWANEVKTHQVAVMNTSLQTCTCN